MNQLYKIINNFTKVRILVVGDLMADKYVWGDGLRLSREGPVNVVTVVDESFSLGGAANVARNARQLGGEVFLVGLVGYDDAAQSFRRAIANSGIDTGGIFPTSERPTTLKVRIMSTEYNQQLMRFDYEKTKPLTKDEKASILKYIVAYMNDIDVIVIADYEKGIFGDESLNRTIIQMAHKNNVITIADSKPGHYEAFKDTFLIVCNYRGAHDFVYIKENRSYYDIEDIGNAMINILKCKALLIIQDGKGLFLFVQKSKYKFFKGISQEIFDLTGIEDTVVSTIAMSMAAGATLEEAAKLASWTLKIVGARKGSSVVSSRELLNFHEK